MAINIAVGLRVGLRTGHHLLAQPMTWTAGVTVAVLLLASAGTVRDAASRAWSVAHGLVARGLSRALRHAHDFRYSDSIGDQHIRLLRIPDSSPGGSPPRLTIHTFPLEACPEYRAISYTWGPPVPPAAAYAERDHVAVFVNGRRFAVRPNLSDALSQVCAARPGGYLWVDNICINQAEPDECSAQVAVMDRIYTGAAETLIWLGPASERSPRAIELVRSIAVGAEAKILQWTSTQTVGDAFVTDDPDLMIKNGLPPLTSRDWEDMGDIYTRSWFGRVWMLQEAALSTRPTVLIGRHEVAWDAVGHTALIVCLSNSLVGLSAFAPTVYSPSLIMGFIHANGLQMVREWSKGHRGRFHHVLAGLDFSAGIKADRASLFLLRLLLSTNGFQATFRRDRVYALLGIANHMAQLQGLDRLDMDVDYQAADDEVLTSFGLGLYRQTESLHLLSLAGLAGRGVESAMATWIPSFETVHAPILGPSYGSLAPLNASREEVHPASFLIDDELHRLHVKTASPNLGTIEELGETLPEMTAGQFTSCIKMLLHCGPTYAYTQQPIVEAFWRTLVMDYDMVERPASLTFARSFAAWMKLITISALCANLPSNPHIIDLFDSLEPLWVLANSNDATELLPKSGEMIALLYQFGMFRDPSVPVASESDRMAITQAWGKDAAPYEATLRLTVLPNRRLARTIRGYLCLVPFKAEVGDKLMIVAGCPTPLVLRRVGPEQDCFHVVGDAYVHGAMFGEHIKEDSVWRDITLV